MPKPKFKSGHLCINHPGADVESFPLEGGAAYMFFDDNGTPKLAIESGTDWIDIEDSEFVGDSESLARVWGIPIDETQAKSGIAKTLKFDVANFDTDDGSVNASFFASVGHRVGRIEVQFPGKMIIKLAMHIDDITEETDDCNTVIALETELTTATKLECPD